MAVGLLAGPLVAWAPATADPEPDVTAPAIWCDAPTGGPIFSTEVEIHCFAADAGGLANEADASFTLTTSVGEDHEAEAARALGRTVCDLAGNCASSGDFGPFVVDRKAPVVTITTPAANSIYPVGVTVTPVYSCVDLTSFSCGSSPMPITSGLHTLTVTGTDRAGHQTKVSRSYQVVGGTLAGTVIGSGSPIGGVQVDVWGPGASLNGAPTASATTTPNGAWRIDGMMPSAPYRVRYSKTGFAVQWHENATSAETANPMFADPDDDLFTPNYLAVLKPLDNEPPVVNCQVPVNQTWQPVQVSFPCTASDANGLASGSPANFVLTTNVAAGVETSDAATNSQVVCDTLGHCTTAGPYGGFKIDRKAPSATCPTPPTAWSATNFSIPCNVTDGGVGSQSSIIALVTNVASGAWTSTASTNVVTLCDRIGNCGPSPQFTNLKVDRAAPTATCGAPPTAWSVNNVSVVCTPSDAGAGYVGPTQVSAVTNIVSGMETANGTAMTPPLCDAVNNCAPKIQAGFKLDRRPPTISCADRDDLWHSANVTFGCTIADGGSGLPATYDAFPPFGFMLAYPTTFSIGTNVAAGAETANASATSGSIPPKCDVLNNCTSVTISGNKIDRKAPVVSCPTPSAGWVGANAVGSCTATDGGSGVAAPTVPLVTDVAAGEESSSASTSPASSCDRTGNCTSIAATGPWKVDRKAPTVICDPPDLAVAYDREVVVSCTATDAGSGLASVADGEFTLTTDVGEGTEAQGSTGSRSICDATGACATVGPFGPFDIDRKAPSVAVTSPEDGAVLTKGTPVLADFACTDAALVSCVGSTPDGQPLPDALGAHELTVTGLDRAGNTTTVTRHYTVVLPDTAPPTISCDVPVPGGTWRADQAIATCTASDPSGLADPEQASFSIATAVVDGTETATASMVRVEVCDALGNCASTPAYGPYKVDRKAPSAPCTGTVPTGWTKSEVAVSCTSSDAGSGSAAPASFSLSTSVGAGNWDAAASTDAREVCDAVGNCRTIRYDGLKVDRAGPSMDCTPAPTGWSKANISVTCTPSDGGSGYGGSATVTASTALPLKSESDMLSVALRACDRLGNCTDRVVSGLKVDRQPPTVTCGTADGAWHGANVSIDCTQVDGGSGLASTAPGDGGPFAAVTTVAAGSESANATAKAAPSCDALGNCTSVSIAGNKVDRRMPSRSCPPSDGLWHGDNVTVSCLASDTGSGLAADSPAAFAASTSLALGRAVSAVPLDPVTTCDAVGNCLTGAPSGSWKIDRRGPTVSVTAPRPDSALMVGVPVTVSFACADAEAGIASCTGPQASGTTFVPTTLGPATFEVVGVDSVGNRSTTVISYRVVAPVGGVVRNASTGQGAAGVVVSRYAATGNGPAIDTAITADDGTFAFPDATPGSYRFGAAKPGAYLAKYFGGSTLASAQVYVVSATKPITVATLSLTPIV